MIQLYIQSILLILAINASNNRDFLGSEAILNRIKVQSLYESEKPTFYFYKAVNQSFLNNTKESFRNIEYLETCENIPVRYQVVSALLKNDLEQRSHDWDDLGDIARDMKKVTDRLHNKDGGVKVQETQKEIVARLDKMIKELEDKAKNNQEGNNSSGEIQKTQKPQAPMGDSAIENTGGNGRVDQQKFRKLQEGFGRLPPREQARAIQELTQGMSPRHREAIENYFRNLANSKGK